MTFTRFLILEWVGRWAVSDGFHGGVKPGPYSLKTEAESAIEVHAKKQRDGWLQSGASEAFAEAEYQLCKTRLHVLQCSFPKDLEPR